MDLPPKSLFLKIFFEKISKFRIFVLYVEQIMSLLV